MKLVYLNGSLVPRDRYIWIDDRLRFRQPLSAGDQIEVVDLPGSRKEFAGSQLYRIVDPAQKWSGGEP